MQPGDDGVHDDMLENIVREFDDDTEFDFLDHLDAKLVKADETNLEYRQDSVENARKIAKLEN